MPFPPTPSITPSNTPTPSVTPSITPTITPTQTSCPVTPSPTQTNTPSATPPTCTCFLLLGNELFSVDYVDCFGDSQNAIASEGFPGQWVLSFCAFSYELTGGSIYSETTSNCFESEGDWYCPV